MKILCINTIDNAGGAALNALRLHKEIKKRGIESFYFTGRKFLEGNETKEMMGYKNIRFLNKYIDRYKLRDAFFTGKTNLFEQDGYKEADLIHLHNIHGGYFRIENLIKLTKEKPVVWTFHDMWPMCGNTPHTFENDWWIPNSRGEVKAPNLIDRHMFNRKRKVYERSNFHIAVPSQWLHNKVEKSILKDFGTTLIHNGIDADNIYPLDKEKTREKYGINSNCKVISFISHGGLKNKWKGGIYMQEVISTLSKNYPLIFLEIGTRGKGIVKEGNHWRIPFVNDRETLNEYLNLSDVFLFTSIAENFPLVLLEAQSAGIPTVTFDVGGSKEIVVHGKTGYVSKYKDVEDSVKGVQTILDSSVIANKYSVSARKRVLENFTLKEQADKYIKLYERAINEHY